MEEAEMKKTVKRIAIWSILMAMAWAILHAVMLYRSEDVYGTLTERADTYMYHKSISCPVVTQGKYKVHVPEGEINALPRKMSREEQKEKCMCWHCTTKPIIIDGFALLALTGLLIIVFLGEFSGEFSKRKTPN